VLQLRELVDRYGNLLHGEIGGTSVNRSVERWVRFRGATGLVGALHSWLAADPELPARTDLHTVPAGSVTRPTTIRRGHT
jgi:hypothetical protein